MIMAMSEDIRKTISGQQWEVTKGHIRASVNIRGSRRLTEPPTDINEDIERFDEWKRFSEEAEKFISLVEDNGWCE